MLKLDYQVCSAAADQILLSRIWLTCAQIMNEMERANRKIVETMTSTERCGPRLWKNKKGESLTADRSPSERRNTSGAAAFCCEDNKPWGRSAATATSLYFALSSVGNVGSQTSWLCGQKSDGWRIWRIRVSEGGETRVKQERNKVRRWKEGQQVAVCHRSGS